jgi:hypothetical protein
VEELHTITLLHVFKTHFVKKRYGGTPGVGKLIRGTRRDL